MKANYDQSFNLDFPRSSLKESALETCNQAILTLPAVCSESIKEEIPVEGLESSWAMAKRSLKALLDLECGLLKSGN